MSDSDPGYHGDTADRSLQEMDNREVESQFGDPTSVSIPAQLRFKTRPSQDTERFHDALEERGYSPVDTDPARRFRGGAPHYDGEVLIQDKHSRVHVMVFRGAVTRLFPHDEYVPNNEEVEGLIKAIELGFDAQLEHDPLREATE